MKREQRAFPLTRVEVRAAGEGTAPKIAGHAAVFGKLSEDLGGWREKIEPGAFKRTLKSADVRALWNHDPNWVLGRNKAGTLSLAEDLTGLAIEIDPPMTGWASDLMVTMGRGDVDQMSFGFRTVRDRWEQGQEGVVRTVLEAELFDVSVVTYPAYPQTDASVRDMLQASTGLDVDTLNRALSCHRHGLPVLDADIRLVEASIDILRGVLPTPAPSDPPQAGHSLDLRRKRLELLAKS